MMDQPHTDTRLIEWFCGSVKLWWAFLLFMPGDMLDSERFKYFAILPIGDWGWGCLFAMAGGGHMTALYINGRWPRSPLFRIGFSSFGFIVFAFMAFAIGHPILEAQSFTEATTILTVTGPGFGVYALISFFQYLSIRLASRDARYAMRADRNNEIEALAARADVSVSISRAVANDAHT